MGSNAARYRRNILRLPKHNRNILRPVQTQYFASPKTQPQYFAAQYRRNILRLPKYKPNILRPVQTQYFASVRYAIVETQYFASVPHAMAAPMNRGFPTFVF